MKHNPYRVTFRLLNLLVLPALLFAGFGGSIHPVQAATPTELFFTEYIEGTSNNKALEIYNGTGAAIDLAAGGYNVQMFFNGSASAGLTINLTSTVADGNVFVLAHSSANATILAEADQTNGAGWFNGDDAVVLRKGTTVIDAIGQAGFDPGSEWGTGLTSTADNTLRRKATVQAGDSNASDIFDPSVEWEGYATDTFNGLGVYKPKLNEFSASTAGTDVEYVEIFGDANTDYSAYTVLEIEGEGTGVGVIDEVINVGTTDANGFWLNNLPANALENGTLTLLLVSDFTGALNADLDTNNDGVFDVIPWTAVVDSVAVNDGTAGDITYGVPTLGPNYDGVSSFAPGGASRIPDGFDTNAATDWVRNDFDLAGIPDFTGTIVEGEAYNTPGAANEKFVPPPFEPGVCGEAFTPIYAVQGAGAASPVVGTMVSVEGVVVGDFQINASADDGDLDGFHLQDPAGDGNPATSDGLFIFAPGGLDVAVGDTVRASGLVSEFNGMTEITASQILLCSTGNSVAPTVLSLPVATVDAFEPYEGMLVTFPQPLVISEYFNYDRFGEIVLTSARHFTPTAIYEPGSPEQAQAAQDFLLDRITLDDGRSAQNPDPAIHPNGNVFDLTNLFRGGDTVANVTGVIDYSFGLYRVQPTQGAVYTNANPRPASPPDVGGSLRVVGMNTLNFFNTFDGLPDTVDNCKNGVNGAPTDCRGADTQAEFDRQWPKTVATILSLNPDVLGVNEIENDGYGPDSAIAFLVDQLNAAAGAGTYAFIDVDTATEQVNAMGTDAIKVGMIYKPATVTPVGQTAVLNSVAFVNGGDSAPRSRPSLAQAFEQNSTGAVFIVDVNHLKSKGSACDVPDTGDGQGNCNIVRTNAATELVNWLAANPTGTGDPDILLIGDYNSYAMEDPITVIQNAGYTNLVASFLGPDAYSYVFDGQIGYLDHALGSASIISQVTGVADYHINADEPDLIDYDTTFKEDAQDAIYAPDPFRSSDHDPVIVGLNLTASTFTGFFPPVQNYPAVNFVNSGSTVAFNFSLGGDQGLDIFAVGYPKYQAYTCGQTVKLLGETFAVRSGSSGLEYDPLLDQYTFVWKTGKGWKNTCAQFVMLLNDGTYHRANFNFVK